MPRVDKLRHYFNHPGFVRPMVDGVLRRWPNCPTDVRDGAHLAFTTHSIPTAAADTSGPVDEPRRRAAPTSPSTWTSRG